MKSYTLSFAASTAHKPDHPERTAKRSSSSSGFDVVYQVWPNRASMAKSIRMQQRRSPHQSDWKAIVPLTDGEGY